MVSPLTVWVSTDVHTAGLIPRDVSERLAAATAPGLIDTGALGATMLKGESTSNPQHNVIIGKILRLLGVASREVQPGGAPWDFR